MGTPGRAEFEAAESSSGTTDIMMDSSILNSMFSIGANKQNAHIEPGMVMQRAVVITARELVEIDVEEFVLGKNKPPLKVRHPISSFTSHSEVRLAAEKGVEMDESFQLTHGECVHPSNQLQSKQEHL